MTPRRFGLALLLASTSATSAAGAFTPSQVEKGRAVWNEPVRGNCGKCHTLDGEVEAGIRTPLAGPKALPKKQYWEMAQGYLYWNTAADVVDFIVSDMPRGRPGTLTQEESLALVAYILSKNGVATDGAELTRAKAEQLVLDDVLPQRKAPYGLYAGIAAAIVGVLAAVYYLVSRRSRSR